MKKSKAIKEIYNLLLKNYGYQGWWPLIKNSKMKYHPLDYSLPKEGEEFEVYTGAILTQNTSWKNVEKALLNLYNEELMDAEKIIKKEEKEIALLIKPSGYYNIKSKKIKEAAKFYLKLKGNVPKREELLSVWGIGEETADSILLYGYKKPSFVVDSYTRKILKSLNLINGKESYGEIKEIFESSIKKDYRMYNEYHALIVEYGKRNLNKNPENPFIEKLAVSNTNNQPKHIS